MIYEEAPEVGELAVSTSGTGRDGTGASPLSLQLEFDCEAERDRACPAPRLQAFCCSNPTRQHRPGWMFSHQ